MPNITDLAPTILYAMDLPIPDDMDGRPLIEAFKDQKQAVTSQTCSISKAISKDKNFSPEDAAEIEKRLRDLGYLG